MNKCFAVTAKSGHVGLGRFIPITYYTMASSGKEAARKVRAFGRVKHDDPMAIISCEIISYEEYIQGIEDNSNHPYFTSNNIQEQRLFNEYIDSLTVRESDDTKEPDKTKAKNKKKYILNYTADKGIPERYLHTKYTAILEN